MGATVQNKHKPGIRRAGHNIGEPFDAKEVDLREQPSIIVNIARRSDWDAAAQSGLYKSESLADEGFIHCSEPWQVVATADALFHGQAGLVLLCIDPTRLEATLRYEESKRGTFPHIYGPLNASAVTDVLEFSPRPDGTFELPEKLSVSSSD